YCGLGTITAIYSDIQGGWEGEGNINVDPLFVDPENGDYHLTEYSPCIDAGNPNSPFDPDGTIADIGAFYYDQGTGVDEEDIQSSINNIQLSNYPNPFNPTTTISFSLNTENSEDTEIAIYNIKSQKVKSFPINQLTNSQVNQIVWNGDDENGKPVSSGLYLYKLTVNGKTKSSKKCLLLK
ncbi:MAG: T9SS type A sorting domain-containing protein, partial [Candidatus Tenebribacter burtonii]|nr:T9SS type A sorting domain-containing protein [Candidatus Tenebribacter burtonii]